jgi:HprK-related kinase A
VILRDLPPETLRRRLAGGGVRIRTGPLVNNIRSRSRKVADGLALHYADYPIEDDAGFADFHVAVAPPRSPRRWLKPQVAFEFDGAAPFFPLPADQAFPTLEWGLNWCVSFHCHQYLIVHAAGVEKAGCALLLPGAPGSGKSTLCAGLVSRGWRLLSDELTLLDFGAGRVVPLPRPVSLKNASIEVIRGFHREATLGTPVHDTAKGSVAHMRAPRESVRRSSEQARPRWIVLPKYVSGVPTTLERLSRARAFMHLADHAFNYDLHGRRGFELLANVVTGCECFEFEYSALEEAVALFDALAAKA